MNELARTASAPFLMRGRIGGTPVERPAYSTEQAEQFAQLAARSGGDSWGSWMVLPHGEDASEPIVLFARYRRGLVGETQRQVHAIGIIAGRLLGPELTTACRIVLPRGQVEFIALGEGMPCERCVSLLPIDDTAAAEATPELPELHPEVAALLAQLGHTSVPLPHRGQVELPPSGRTETPLDSGHASLSGAL